ncbi:hypothetical protein [Lactiplantibacillus paraxiangfangensis]|uniref:hypothetical protein n=1 Tax=Lactiplantibacillus paraxiangfangensis TaxID=3076224 RepID=UPI0030C7462B
MNMKKLSTIGASLLVGIALTACSNGGTNESANISSLKSENISLKNKIKQHKTTTTNTNGKTSSTVGIVQYKVTGYSQKKLINKESNYTTAENNDEEMKNIGKSYYRTTIDYTLKNVGNRAFALSYYKAGIITDDNIEYTDTDNANYVHDSNSNADVHPGISTSGKFVLISKEAPSMKHFKINVSEQCDSSGEVIGKSGIAEFK